MRQYIIIIISVIISVISCKKESYYGNSDVKLSFSTDTIFFDTVFTSVGSVTKQLKVYNNNDGNILISSIRLGKGTSSNYRLNINGINSSSANNIELEKGDSLYIFIEVTVDPQNTNTPYVVADSIVFSINANNQDIDLRSWGQEANYIDGRYSSAIIKDTVWTNIKPFLIYNSMMVDTGQTLVIEEGTQIFLHKNSSIYVMGTLIIKGTKDNPVIIRGDRLEPAYDDVPGQWSRLVFVNPSKNNIIDYAEIKGGIIGVQVGGNIESSSKPDLKITNTKIEHMNYSCLYTIGSTVLASNCVFADAGFYPVALLMGGNYEFYHSTIANYWAYATRTEPSLVITNNLTSNNSMYVSDLTNAYFGNCIIYGTMEDELGLSNDAAAEFNYKFENCIVRNSSLDFSDNSIYLNVWKDMNPNFINYSNYNWELDTMSNAENKGNIDIVNSYPYLPLIITDLNDYDRTTDGNPDLGAYERQY